MEEPRNLSHLIPTKATMEAAAAESLEGSLIKQLLKGLGARASILRQAEKRAGKLDVPWVKGQYTTFPFNLAVRRIKNFSIQDLFNRPSKSAVYEAFIEEFKPYIEEPCVLLIKEKGFTSLAMCNSPVMGEEVRTVLRFRIRDRSFYVSTMKEFCDAYRERSGALDS